ncbi:MAG: pentapeptide repeat-containing protein [Actinomycetota bacterium]
MVVSLDEGSGAEEPTGDTSDGALKTTGGDAAAGGATEAVEADQDGIDALVVRYWEPLVQLASDRGADDPQLVAEEAMTAALLHFGGRVPSPDLGVEGRLIREVVARTARPSPEDPAHGVLEAEASLPGPGSIDQVASAGPDRTLSQAFLQRPSQGTALVLLAGMASLVVVASVTAWYLIRDEAGSTDDAAPPIAESADRTDGTTPSAVLDIPGRDDVADNTDDPATDETPDPTSPSTTTGPTATSQPSDSADTTAAPAPLGPPVDYARQSLAGIGFEGEDLRGADFSGAMLTGVRFTSADLQGADFSGAVLNDVDLSGADLRGVNLTGVLINGTEFAGSDLTNTTFVNANMNRVEFGGADVSGADFTNANFTGGSTMDGFWSPTNPPTGLAQ